MKRVVLPFALISIAFVAELAHAGKDRVDASVAYPKRNETITAKTQPACTNPPPQMTAWWPFNEASGGTAADLAGGHHATHMNGAMPVKGRVGKGLAFDGIDSYATAPHDAALDFGKQFSLDFWIRPDAGETAGTIYRKGTPSSNPPYLSGPGFHLLYNKGHFIGGFAGTSSSFFTDFTPNLTDHADPGQWTFVALTIDLAGGSATLFIDGQAVKTQPLLTSLGSLANSEPVILGGTDEATPSPDRSFAGVLDEVELFNRLLTPAEIGDIQLADWSGKCGSPNCSGPEELRVGTGDKSLGFYPDEAGALFGCNGGSGNPASNGVRFDPAGPLPESNVNCSTMLYVFDQAGTRRQALSVHAVPHNSCACTGPVPEGGACFYEPLCQAGDQAHLTCGDITSDTGTFYFSPTLMRRTTTFTLPNFPGLVVKLVQDMYLDRFEQTYRFTNTTAQAIDLRLARVADADIGYLDDTTYTGNGVASTGGYVRNLSSFVTSGAAIRDNTTIGLNAAPVATFEVTAPNGGGSDATFEGARLQGNGGSAHGRTWWNYGVPVVDLGTYGVDVDYWNTQWIGGTPKNGESDQAVVIQSLLTVPPGQTKSYITVTKVK
jgi:hypothetical protein